VNHKKSVERPLEDIIKDPVRGEGGAMKELFVAGGSLDKKPKYNLKALHVVVRRGKKKMEDAFGHKSPGGGGAAAKRKSGSHFIEISGFQKTSSTHHLIFEKEKEMVVVGSRDQH